MTPLTIRQLSERFPAFSEPALRNLVFRAKPRQSRKGTGIVPGNGLGRAIFRIGTKVLIDLDLFQAWLHEKQSGAANGAANAVGVDLDGRIDDLEN